MDGVLVVDKPPGMTSHDVVDAVRKKLGMKKVGHAGTLDPDATGLLVLGLGSATRFLAYAQAGPKRYRAGARFGISTSTQDASGEVVSSSEMSVTEDRVRAALGSYTGSIEQVPPMVSAVKVGGERLYKKALRGEEVARAARTVVIHSLDLVAFDAERQTAELDVTCSSGTYIRTLIHDLGSSLGTGAHMTSLRRTETGGFALSDAVALDAVEESVVLPVVAVVGALAKVQLDEDAAADVRHGRKLPATLAGDLEEGQPAALARGDELLAVYRRAGHELVADRVVGS
jgi:tRNA pseudouridine55 synthase